jgi:hypothetical protein
MSQTLIPPSSLDTNGLERLVAQMSVLSLESGTINLDLGHAEFIDPYGMAGLLELGRYLSKRGHKLLLHLPLSMEVQRCLDRMDFFRYVSESYIMYPPYRPFAARAGRVPSSDVLLEITRIAQPDDIDIIINKIKERTGSILETGLHYKKEAVQEFLSSIYEMCRNIIEHSRDSGLVAMQVFPKEKYPDKNTIRVAVMDLGIGFKGSLSSRLGGRWSDAAALEETLLPGASRNPESGQGRGLTAVQNFARRWGAEISIRSGTVKWSVLPGLDCVGESGLPEFPGVRISLVLPEV